MATRPRALFASLLTVAAWAATASERLHVVIPAGPGGGLDGTAREVGRVFVELLERPVSVVLLALCVAVWAAPMMRVIRERRHRKRDRSAA